MSATDNMYTITYAKPADAYLEVLAERVSLLSEQVQHSKPTSKDPDDNDGGSDAVRDYMHNIYKIRLVEARSNLKLARKMLL